MGADGWWALLGDLRWDRLAHAGVVPPQDVGLEDNLRSGTHYD